LTLLLGLLSAVVVFGLALSLNAVAYALARPFERKWPPLDPVVARGLGAQQVMIVVLGGGKRQGAIEYADHETLSSASFRRAVYAAHLAEQTGLPLAISGGKPGGGSLGEAALMKTFIEKGLRQPVALIEDESSDTRQNAMLMSEKLAQLDVDTIVLVTDVLHMPRAVRAFQSTGISVVAAPLHFQASAPLSRVDFLPSVQGLSLSRYVLQEYFAAIWYRVRSAIA